MLHDNERIDAVGTASMDLMDMVTFVDHLEDVNGWPLSIMGTDYGPDQRFDVVWAQHGQLMGRPRTLRVTRLTDAGIAGDTPRAAAAAHQPSLQAESSMLPDAAAAAPETGRAVAEADDAAITADTVPVRLDEGVQIRSLPAAGPGSAPADPAVAVSAVAADNTVRFLAVDQLVVAQMKQHGVRAAQLAVAHQGALKYAAAYTWAPEAYPDTTLVQRMRAGSISKAIASMALVRLAEVEQLDLFSDDLATLFAVPVADDGWATRTAAQTACHVGNFAEDLAFRFLDPWRVIDELYQLDPRKDSDPQAVLTELVPLPRERFFDYLAAHEPPPTSASTGYFLNQPAGELMLGGGVETAYTNFAYEVIGDVIRQQSEDDYVDWLHERITGLLRIPDARVQPTLGQAARIAATPDEVRYHARVPRLGASEYAGVITDVPQRSGGTRRGILPTELGAHAYDGLHWQLGVASSALALSAIDVVRLFSSFDLPAPNPIYAEASSIESLIASQYATRRTLGFFGSPAVTLSHDGLAPGTAAIAFRDQFLLNNIVAALIFNTDINLPELDSGVDLGPLGHELRTRLRDIHAGVGFPAGDLFEAPGILT